MFLSANMLHTLMSFKGEFSIICCTIKNILSPFTKAAAFKLKWLWHKAAPGDSLTKQKNDPDGALPHISKALTLLH